jgi:hypothetical protein
MSLLSINRLNPQRRHPILIPVLRLAQRPPDGGGYAITYACRIDTSFDHAPPNQSLPEVCIKIFDDRWFPIKYSISHPSSFQSSYTAFERGEELTRKEESVYRRLGHVQGSAIPWYYGAHLASICRFPFLSRSIWLIVFIISSSLYQTVIAHTES